MWRTTRCVISQRGSRRIKLQERVAHLEQQRNRLEATLSPQLVTAFSNLDTEAALRLVAMFRSMERGGQLTKYYHKCVRAGLLQRWAAIVSEGEGESPKVWIGQFYTELLASLREHNVWVAQVFPGEQPGHLLAQLVVQYTILLAFASFFIINAHFCLLLP